MILAYHRVNPWYKEDALTVLPENFKRQMEYLLGKKFNFVSPEDYFSEDTPHPIPSPPRVEGFTGEKLNPSPRLQQGYGGQVPRVEGVRGKTLVTFDDGYADNLWHALPVLKKLGIKPVIFLTVNYIGSKDIFKRYKNIERDRFMDWGEVREMSAQGVVFGSHSLSHPHLTQIEGNSLRREVAGSKKEIEDRTGREAGIFCYPYGDFNERVIDAVEKAGYKGAVVTPGMKRKIKTGRYAMPRTGIYGHNGFTAFRIKIWKNYLTEKYF
ncbi:MAG: polysaccharide deacetylase family protein [Candidatus Omnitrophica bacterium]|nr:polysaccharide deacetylase family protein [Candidatus Omnitrophota bacterium]